MKTFKNAVGFFFVIFFIHMNLVSAQDQFRLLMFTQHDDWHAECIPAAVKAFKAMSIKNQFHLEWTQQPDDMVAKLNHVDVLVFVNASANNLSNHHFEGLKKYMQEGGGFVGIHATADSKLSNEWFDGLVGGAFKDHPKLQAGIINVRDAGFPATLHLPKKWLWSDEWYNFKNLQIDQLNVVLTVDETSYDYTLGYDDIPLEGMGDFHPIAWSHEYEGGKVFYTALGHKPQAYNDNNFLEHIFGGIYWVLK